jgi:hypothetical protein
VTLTYGGAKLKFNATYTAEMLYRSSESQFELNHQFSGGTQGSMELVPQFLFLDTASNVSQYNTSVNGPLATSNINTTGNRSTVRTTTISPYIRYNFPWRSDWGGALELQHGDQRFERGQLVGQHRKRLHRHSRQRPGLRPDGMEHEIYPGLGRLRRRPGLHPAELHGDRAASADPDIERVSHRGL